MHFETSDGARDIEVLDVIVAGWTGRDADKVRYHIDELAEIGVPGPSTVPLYYRVSSSLLTQAAEAQVLGTQTSGEVEPLILRTSEGLWLGLGSDHTDRALEAHSVAASKQVCAKPIASCLWRWDEVADHLDAIRLRSWISEGGSRVPYQDGTIGAILPLGDLVESSGLLNFAVADVSGAAILCGTVPVLSGGIRPSKSFEMEMTDPVRDRTIRHSYRTSLLDVVC